MRLSSPFSAALELFINGLFSLSTLLTDLQPPATLRLTESPKAQPTNLSITVVITSVLYGPLRLYPHPHPDPSTEGVNPLASEASGDYLLISLIPFF